MRQADTIKKFNEKKLEWSVVDPIDAEHNVENLSGSDKRSVDKWERNSEF